MSKLRDFIASSLRKDAAYLTRNGDASMLTKAHKDAMIEGSGGDAVTKRLREVLPGLITDMRKDIAGDHPLLAKLEELLAQANKG